MAAAAAEAEYVIAVDRHRSRLDLALELGATHVVDSTGLPVGEIANQVKGIAMGGTDTALDTTGAPCVVAAAVAALRAQGTLGLAATVAGPIELPGDALATGKTVTGILEGDAVPRALIPELIDLWRQGRLPFDRLIRTYPMSDINQAEGPRQGLVHRATVLADLAPNATPIREEIFGPVLAVLPYDDIDHAVSLANDSDHGLGGTVWTRDVARGLEVARRVEAGAVGVNFFDLDLGAPFGGSRDPASVASSAVQHGPAPSSRNSSESALDQTPTPSWARKPAWS